MATTLSVYQRQLTDPCINRRTPPSRVERSIQRLCKQRRGRRSGRCRRTARRPRPANRPARESTPSSSAVASRTRRGAGIGAVRRRTAVWRALASLSHTTKCPSSTSSSGAPTDSSRPRQAGRACDRALASVALPRANDAGRAAASSLSEKGSQRAIAAGGSDDRPAAREKGGVRQGADHARRGKRFDLLTAMCPAFPQEAVPVIPPGATSVTGWPRWRRFSAQLRPTIPPPMIKNVRVQRNYRLA